MSPTATVVHNARRLPRYLRSAVRIGRELRDDEPDVVVNFFDLVEAAALLLFRPGRVRLAVGHHFLTGHPEFPRPSEARVGWWGLRLPTRLCALDTSHRLALSFRPLPDPDPETGVVPPLLRRAVLEAEPAAGEHLQVYVLNPGYARELKGWHRRNRDVRIEAFWDREDAPECLEVHPNLRFHRIDDRKFVEGLRRCRALATTAGFEAVCESMYLGKPVLMVPTEGHVEQSCNAEDAVRAGAGIRRDRFALDDLRAYLEDAEDEETAGPDQDFRSWVRSAPGHLLGEIERAFEAPGGTREQGSRRRPAAPDEAGPPTAEGGPPTPGRHEGKGAEGN